jgi:hypothetical protein
MTDILGVPPPPPPPATNNTPPPGDSSSTAAVKERALLEDFNMAGKIKEALGIYVGPQIGMSPILVWGLPDLEY